MISPGKVVVVIQARMTSARLPGKTLAPLAGRPALLRMVERVRRVRGAARHLVATSTDRSDDPIADLCRAEGIPCARGPLDDVLGRIHDAVPLGVEAVVRLTADCPLVDPALVDRHIARYGALPPGPRYVTNAVTRTYPDGLDVEVMSIDLLNAAYQRAVAPPDREHVTPWIQRTATVSDVTQTVDLSGLRWVLDTPSDYVALSGVYQALHPEHPDFGSLAVYRLMLRRPDLMIITDGTAPAEMQRRITALLAEAAA